MYDAVGNRTQMTSTVSALGTGTTSYSYDANDRLTTDTIDNNGNTTLSGGVSNTYDFENRMTAHQTTTPTTMVYDGDGNRASETVGGATTKYLVDTLNPTGLPQVLDETVNSSVTRTYGYGLQRISENQMNGPTWTPSFYGYDGHGNVRFLTNSAATVTDTYQYDAFGRLIATIGNTPNNFEYSGEQFDGNVGLYNLRARYYNQATGRFMTMDPYDAAGCQACGCPACTKNPAGLNKYLYAAANPVNGIDPTGYEAVEEYKIQLAAALTFTTAVLATNYEYRNHVVGNFVVALVQKIVDYEKCTLQFIADEANCYDAYREGLITFAGLIRCLRAAQARYDFSTGKIPGPVQ